VLGQYKIIQRAWKFPRCFNVFHGTWRRYRQVFITIAGNEKVILDSDCNASPAFITLGVFGDVDSWLNGDDHVFFQLIVFTAVVDIKAYVMTATVRIIEMRVIFVLNNAELLQSAIDDDLGNHRQFCKGCSWLADIHRSL